MVALSKYWARIKAVVCVAVAFGILLLPAPTAHADMMKNTASYNLSAAQSGHDHPQHSTGFDTQIVTVSELADTDDNHHDDQCCPAGCISVALVDLFTNVLSKKTGVPAGLTPFGLTSVDVSDILRPPLT